MAYESTQAIQGFAPINNERQGTDGQTKNYALGRQSFGELLFGRISDNGKDNSKTPGTLSALDIAKRHGGLDPKITTLTTALSTPKNETTSPDAQTSEVRGVLPKNEIRMAINRTARHKDATSAPSAIEPNKNITPKPNSAISFTQEEEELLLTVAEAEKHLNNIRANMRSKLSRERNTSAKGTDSNNALEGTLSAGYESNGSPDAIGYDSRGGTSYGTYQIASRPGTMNSFLKFLWNNAPDLAERLAAAGPSDTGGRDGLMPRTWKAIAKENPERFEKLQHDFIRKSHYQPALRDVMMNTGIDVAQAPMAIREVLWSTSVQHGPLAAAEIFTQATNLASNRPQDEFHKSIIENVYDIRSRQFGKHNRRVQAAVKSRFVNEKQTAIAMLDGQELS